MAKNNPFRPRVAVCLAAYNGMSWIEAQVDSILTQENVDIRIIVAVDHSADGTEEWLRAFAARDPRVILLPTGPASGGAVQNFFRLLREGDFTGCDYIALSAQSNIWLPSKLTWAVERLNEANAQAYSSEALAFWPNGRRKLICKT